ncbi:hypothetical protein ACFY2R_00185 [Micromonospora olivasterospora]|uniref:Uncharacterized protein n=1 Tax=Micromonospora olivasterospora TaxID=1880 RepID=A0A562I9N4_MICOL|nr:hypothetical protein [Micromonospora olivasterospora]TWH67691.1 hypothetical protein JD77_02671 [Micromonospora olivasterospora]
MADRHVIIHLIEHDDGGLTSKRWPMDAEQANLAVAALGDPASTGYLAGEDRDRLAPLVSRASIVDQHERGEAA